MSSVSPIGAAGYYAEKDDRFDSSKVSPDQSFGKRYFSKIGDEEQSLWSEFGNLREEEDELLDKPQTAQVKNDLEEVRRAIADAKGRLKVFEKRRMADPDVYYAEKDDRLEKRFEGISPEDKVFIRERLIDAEKAALATVDDSLKKGEITEAQADKQRLEVMRIIAENRRYV
jgi:hypothetical protein